MRTFNPDGSGVSRVSNKKSKRPSVSSGSALNASKKATHKRPPDPDGLFERAASRARDVLAMYDVINPGLGDDYLVSNLLHDLLHLCDRDHRLGNFHESHGSALALYQDLAAENICDLGWYDDLEAATEAAERMLFRET
jgi:hypothetical protein